MRTRIGTGAHVNIDVLDAGVADSDQCIVRAHFGHGRFGQDQIIGLAVLFYLYRLHWTTIELQCTD